MAKGLSTETIRIAVLGASGYTGADLIRLAARHRAISISALVAKSHAGKAMDQVFPHLGGLGLPDLVEEAGVDWDTIDAVFCGLPHATAHQIIMTLPGRIKVIDMSADFRLRDKDVYEQWYDTPHRAPDLLQTAIYGLSEHYRSEIAEARLVACPGCFPTAALLALLPVVKDALVEPADLIIDAKTGVSGAGRSLKQNTLFSEAGESLAPYAIAGHRHAPEIEQEISKAAGRHITVSFTPHLVPMSRGELCTCYVQLVKGRTAADLRASLQAAYKDAPFVRVLPDGQIPATGHVRGSNIVHLGVFADRIAGRAIIVAALDNLVKGSAGQALQNFNLMYGLDERQGLEQLPLFP